MARVAVHGKTPDTELASVDLIVMVQIRRGEYSQAELENASIALPLTAMVVVFGPWCEGETRSGHPLSNVPRISISNWSMAFERFKTEFRLHGTSQWHQPPVVSELQQMLDPPWPEMNALSDSKARKLNVAISGSDRVSSESLTNLVESCGWQAINPGSSKRSETANVMIVDCYFSIDEAIGAVTEMNCLLPVVAILGFARQSDREKLAAISPKSMVIGKPFANDDLLQAILRVTRHPSTGIPGEKSTSAQ